MKDSNLKGIAFLFILLCAIGVSFWGIWALLLMAGAPMAAAIAGGLVFDALALWLGHEASEIALTEESSSGLEWTTYLVVAASMYLNWLHAELTGMGQPLPYVMALFPLAAGILFHFFLKRRTKEWLRAQKRVVNRNPVLGKLTWLRFFGKSFKVWSKAVESNLARASAQIETFSTVARTSADTYIEIAERFTQAESVSKPSLAPAVARVQEAPVRLPMGFSAQLPSYVSEAKPNGSAVTKACVDNGVTDAHQIRTYAVEHTGKDISITNIQKYVSKYKGF